MLGYEPTGECAEAVSVSSSRMVVTHNCVLCDDLFIGRDYTNKPVLVSSPCLHQNTTSLH